MSWAANEWKDQLSPKALQKVEALEKQLDRVQKEVSQKGFQLQSFEQVRQFRGDIHGFYDKLHTAVIRLEIMPMGRWSHMGYSDMNFVNTGSHRENFWAFAGPSLNLAWFSWLLNMII